LKKENKLITIRINNELNPRTEILDNVDHVVYPVIMINEGVHNRIFYPNSELERSVQNWNGSPIPIYHPEKNGIPISCNSPEIYNKQVVGKVFNSHMDGDNLKADLYLNKDKVNSLMPDLFTFLENDGQMDVSTGLFSDDIYQTGDFEGEEYDSIAVNIRPDHLAILPGQKGACSWEDGCGIRANQEKQKNKKNDGGKMKRGNKKPKNNIDDVEEIPQNEKQETKINKKEGNEMKTMKECCPDTVNEFIKQNSQFEGKEDDLMSMTEDVFKMVVLGTDTKGDKEPKVNTKKDDKANDKEPKTLSFDEVMAKADPETRESIAMGKKLLKNHRSKLIDNIKANSNEAFTDEELNGFDLDMLEKLVSMAGSNKTNNSNNYGLQAPITNTTQEDEIEPLPDPTFDFDKE